jgi:hypothetical protein
MGIAVPLAKPLLEGAATRGAPAPSRPLLCCSTSFLLAPSPTRSPSWPSFLPTLLARPHGTPPAPPSVWAYLLVTCLLGAVVQPQVAPHRALEVLRGGSRFRDAGGNVYPPALFGRGEVQTRGRPPAGAAAASNR